MSNKRKKQLATKNGFYRRPGTNASFGTIILLNLHAGIRLTDQAKVFVHVGLFGGVAFISNIGILMAPIAHHFFHQIHLQNQHQDDEHS